MSPDFFYVLIESLGLAGDFPSFRPFGENFLEFVNFLWAGQISRTMPCHVRNENGSQGVGPLRHGVAGREVVRHHGAVKIRGERIRLRSVPRERDRCLESSGCQKRQSEDNQLESHLFILSGLLTWAI